MYTKPITLTYWRPQMVLSRVGFCHPFYLLFMLDGLFHRLKKRGVCCHQMSNYFIGCLLYADDVALLCPAN